MQVYSSTILSFITRLRSLTRDILQHEMNLVVRRNHFKHGRYLVPFHLVVFEREKVLGLFDPHTYQIGINKCLMYQAKTAVIKDVLRHELAHLMAYLQFGSHNHDHAHGKEFHDVCRSYGWGESVWKAETNLQADNDALEGDLTSERIIHKVQKLLQLSSSANPHEASLATIKANSLLLRHNLECFQSQGTFSGATGEEETVYVDRVLCARKNGAKMQAIYEILQTFLVHPVFNYGKGQVYLEVTGSRANVELARYVAAFLEAEIERCWERNKEEFPLAPRGISSRNSFILGIAKGYRIKWEEAKNQNFDRENQLGLIALGKELERKVQMVYGRLSHSSSSRSFCQQSARYGEEMGRRLSIHPAIQSESGGGPRLLSHDPRERT